MAAVFKFGFQESIQRFFPEICRDRPEAERSRFYTSFLFIPCALSLVVTIVLIVILYMLHQVSPFEYFSFLIIALILGEMAAIISLMENIMRAREFSGLLSLVRVISRYIRAGLVVIVIYYASKTALGVYAARSVTEFCVLIWMILCQASL